MTKITLPRLTVGRPIPAATINRFIEAVETVSNMALAGGLSGISSAAGKAMKYDGVSPFEVKLSGPTSPYSWNEVFLNRDTDPPTWTTLGGRSGTSNAYEYNNASMLNGQIVELTPAGGTWFKFALPRKGKTPPCPTGIACITLDPVCSGIADDTTITLTFTPDGGGSPVTVTGAGPTLCVTHAGPGVVAWSFTSTNFFGQSGTFDVTECGNGGGPTIDIYPTKYKVCLVGCNIATDGTAVTITLSGSASGSCTPTLVTSVFGGHSLCCTFTLTAPMTVPPTITVTADRYKMGPYGGFGGPTICSANINMLPDDGYFCCDPTGTGTCKPIKCTLVLSTPVGDFHIDKCSSGSTPFVTATVAGKPNVAFSGHVECGCDFPALYGSVPVTFYLTEFTCINNTSGGLGGWSGVIEYQACPHDPASIDCGAGQGNDWIATEDGATDCLRAGTGAFLFSLSGVCPPGEVGTFSSEGCHNRYLSGSYTLTES